MYEALAILGTFGLIYSIVATRIERTWITGPIIFVATGFIIGPTCLNLLPFKPDAETLSVLAELTLALVLFTDAAGTDLGVLRRAERLPIRLLAIGLPLTILLGFGVGKAIFPGLMIFEIALIATMLAPTDAALGKGVITNKSVPNSVRQGLNVESGLNDGICVPILVLFLTLAQGQAGDGSPLRLGIELFGKVVGVGLITGVVMSGATVLALRIAMRRDWLSPTWNKVIVIALAFACFGIAQALGGSGFIACFVGGMLFGGLLKPNHEKLLVAAEGIGDTFALLTWVVFGVAAVGPAVSGFSWPALLYALLSLTVIRMLPVFLVLSGLRANTEAKLFIGWFGPRGLASIVFAVIVLNAALPNGEVITATVVYTVLLSILLHGLTANPWARGFGKRAGASGAATLP